MCWTCGKPGHLQAKCWQGSDRGPRLNHQDEEGLTFLEVIKSKPLMNASTEEQAQCIHFIVDSGAAETVVPSNTMGHITTNKGQKFGTVYKGIEGSTVTNVGEKT
eukprot:NODE_5110_length_612_cov_1.202873.p2 GENE.NODE_5110_length_612_cov_1.202873~~NODE_5110_length_612_cov_1.202873.p2  ORF type:complete len:105 (+),score=19.44 NODE_5110_length_612_cov_1.202873:182-496(+)